MNTTANANTPSNSATEKYLDAFPKSLPVTPSHRRNRLQPRNYRNHLIRKAKECQQMDEAFWKDASLAMIHAWIATSELSEGIEKFNNTVELGNWEADELDGELSEGNYEFHTIISAWIHQAPHTDHLEKVCAAAAQTNPPRGNCHSTTDGERTWLTCEDGIERQAPCHNCPTTAPLRKYDHDAEALKEMLEPDEPPHRESYLAEILKPAKHRRHPLGPHPGRRHRHRQTGRRHRQNRPAPPRSLGPSRHPRRASHKTPVEPAPQGAHRLPRPGVCTLRRRPGRRRL